jgi:predicted ester cyclase
MTMKVDLMCDGADLEAFYRRYLKRCNERRLGELGQFVGEDVEVNGMVRGLRWYVDGIASVIEAFPDFHWDLRHLLVDGCWLGARLADTATTPAGQPVSIRELAMTFT